MFDDLKNQSSAPNSGQEDEKNKKPQSEEGVTVPPTPPKSAGAGRVEDIFAETDKAPQSSGIEGKPEKPPIFQPKVPATPAQESALQKAGLPGRTEEKISTEVEQKSVDSLVNIKKFTTLGIIILAIIIVLGGGWYGYGYFFKSSDSLMPVDIPADEQDENDTDENKSADKGAPIKEENIQPTEPPPVKPLDTDEDGLTDEEERRLGTKINSIDSDNDGLFDQEEVKVYKTDPLNSDTDGDGFMDGEEVKSGYNPKGAGKLYEIK